MNKVHYVSLVDRSPARRLGVTRVLSGQGFHVEPFEDAEEFLEFRPRTGVVLVHDDDSLLDPLVAGMAVEHCWYPHVVYTEDPHWRRAIVAMQKGAKTYVAFPEQAEEIPSLLSSVHRESLDSVEAVRRKAKARARMSLLTPREREVLDCVIAGDSGRKSSEKLGISERTVDVHRANLLKKMAAKNGADLVRIALLAGYRAVQAV